MLGAALETPGTSARCCSSNLTRQQSARTQGRGHLAVVHAKKDIHPKYYDEAKVICNGEEVLTTSGTQETYTVDVWSGNHPFYTKSENTMISDEGRVSRFNKRFDGLTMGQVAASKPGEKKLEYKAPSKQKGKPQKGGKR